MKKLKIYFLTNLIVLFINSQLISQNGLIGSGFGTNNWSITDNFVGSSGTSRIGIFTPNGTGNQYFRLVTNWTGNYNQWGPSSSTEDYSVSTETEIPSSEIIQNSTPKATIITPIIAENPFDGIPFASTKREISFRNSVNLTITKPKPIKAMLVRIQDKNVLSFARCSLDVSKAFFSLDSFMRV